MQPSAFMQSSRPSSKRIPVACQLLEEDGTTPKDETITVYLDVDDDDDLEVPPTQRSSEPKLGPVAKPA